MKKKTSYRWLIWIILAVVLIGVALMAYPAPIHRPMEIRQRL